MFYYRCNGSTNHNILADEWPAIFVCCIRVFILNEILSNLNHEYAAMQQIFCIIKYDSRD